MALDLYATYRGLQVISGVLESRPRNVGNGGRFSAETSRRAEARNRASNNGSFKCEDCGEDFDKDPAKKRKDHEKPFSKGGGNDVDNLKYRCESCNAQKADHDPSVWEQIKQAAGIGKPD